MFFCTNVLLFLIFLQLITPITATLDHSRGISHFNSSNTEVTINKLKMDDVNE